jgi:hypothetical protein
MRAKNYLHLCVVLLFLNPSARACLGPESETTTFLSRLPARAMEKDIVAKVEVIQSKTEKIATKIGDKIIENDSKIVAKVKVLQALKGTKKGSIINIIVMLSSCSREPKTARGQQYYLAGTVGTSGEFDGQWKASDLINEAKE